MFARSRKSTWRVFARVSRQFTTGNLQVAEEITDALHYGRGVVALESTIITHGMPYPENLKTALSVENKVRDFGSIPATVGIIKGKIKVGLSKEELEYLADPSTSVVKTSRRDFPMVIGKKLNGGTTVSGTMIVAHMAGIQMFVTGGIGGVHRGVQDTMDISADLTELGRTPVVVVSSGVKSILDIGRTLEYLETEGVCVCSYGNSRDFPAFFSPKSGFQAPYNVDGPSEAAEMIASHYKLGLKSGMLMAVPIPEEYAAVGEEIEGAIQSAVDEARKKNILGRDVTPNVLNRLNEISEGKSLLANIALIENNAAIGSQIAQCVAEQRENNQSEQRRGKSKSSTTIHTMKRPDVTVIGGSIVDFYARIQAKEFESNGATYPGNVQQSFGGVGRNIADCLSRLDVNTLFISAIGRDSHNAPFKTYCQHMNLQGVAELSNHKTATYCAFLRDSGQLLYGIGDMEIHDQITPQYIERFSEDIRYSKLICLDGNITVEAIQFVCKLASSHNVPVWYEPTDFRKAYKPINKDSPIWITSPNMNELRAMHKYITCSQEDFSKILPLEDMSLDKVLAECIDRSQVMMKYVPVILVKIGKHGVVLSQRKSSQLQRVSRLQSPDEVTVDWFPTSCHGNETEKIVSVSGAGDCMVAAVISSTIRGLDLETSMKKGVLAAQASLRSNHAVPPYISMETLELTNEISEGLAPKRITTYKIE